MSVSVFTDAGAKAETRYASRKWIAFWAGSVLWFLFASIALVRAGNFAETQQALLTWAEWQLYFLGTYCTLNVLQFAAGRLNVQAKP